MLMQSLDRDTYIKTCLDIVGRDPEAKKILAKAQEILSQWPDDVKWRALDELWKKNLSIYKCLEIIFNKQAAASLCHNIMMMKTQLESSLDTSINTLYSESINLVAIINYALDVFEKCYGGVAPDDTRRIRALLGKEKINIFLIENTNELSREQSVLLIEAMSQTLDLWRIQKPHFFLNTASILRACSAEQIERGNSPLGVPPILLMAKEIEKFKKKSLHKS